MNVDKALGGGIFYWPRSLIIIEIPIQYFRGDQILNPGQHTHNIDNLIEAHCSVQGRCWPPLSVFITNYQLINSALSLFRKYPEKLSSNIDPAPLAVASGQSASHPPPLIEPLQFVKQSFWFGTKLSENGRLFPRCWIFSFSSFFRTIILDLFLIKWRQQQQ